MKRLILTISCALALSVSAEARTWRVDAEASLQSALSAAAPGDEIRLGRGRLTLSGPIALTRNDVALRGEGASQTILSFANQSGGAPAITIGANGVALRDLAIADMSGSAVEARDCTGLTISGISIAWPADARSSSPPGGMTQVVSGVVVRNCANVLIEKSAVSGATHAGIMLTGARNAILTENQARGNVAGVAIQNSIAVDLSKNQIDDNVTGVVVVNSPGQPQQDGRDIRIFDNDIARNNNASFTHGDDRDGALSFGTGITVIAGRNVHIFNNRFSEHGAAHIFVTAFRGRFEDASYNPLPQDISIRDNRMGRQGFAAGGALRTFAETGVALPDVLWDGATTYSAAGAMPRAAMVRILMRGNSGADGDGAPTFLSLGLTAAGMDIEYAQPDTTLSNTRDIQEPRPIRLP
ncbi:MAG: parallel beta-helix domain-containing protein [Caulobacterales bacterium]